jgi:hypothetical protein
LLQSLLLSLRAIRGVDVSANEVTSKPKKKKKCSG